MSKHTYIISLLLCMAIALSGKPLNAQTGIVNTKHNLSVSGPGTIKATSEERICVFCHTPHNANPQTPLWNKNIEGINYDQYTPYTSSTLGIPAALQIRPTGSSRLCLSCHDGTLALGDVKLPKNQIDVPVAGVTTVPGGMPHASPSYFGTSLANHHPISFSYYSALPNPELSPTLPQELLYYGNGIIQCNTCHDPHDNSNKKFLAVSNVESGLCTLCHIKEGWDATSSHKMEGSIAWNGLEPNPWPRTGASTEFGWNTVKENGCENCHSPHSAVGQQRLLNCYTATGPCSPATQEGVCFPCHNGHMAIKNIFAQLEKTSNHRVTNPFMPHDPLENENPLLIGGYGHVECVDCHNPHAANGDPAQVTGGVSGRLRGVSGMSADGAAKDPAEYEYEVCFKCHGSSLVARSLGFPIQRVLLHINTRMEFQLTNASYHPVVGSGRSNDVPSLIQPLGPLSQILCTDCHSDDGNDVSRGPHGSQFPPILRNRYLTADDNLLYNRSNFQLCYNCHSYSSIESNESFPQKPLPWNKDGGGHSGHLGYLQATAETATCAVCHDPHGVNDDGEGNHTRLINFDKLIVSALTDSGYSKPMFNNVAPRSGNCTLVCHGETHRALTHFYTYP
jgi:predicted CXXCH cytochrome family protein